MQESQLSIKETLSLFFKGIGSVLSVWPQPASLPVRTKIHTTTVFASVARLCSSVRSRGLAFSNESAPQKSYFDDILSYNVLERSDSVEYFSRAGAFGIAPLLVLMHDSDISVRDKAYKLFGRGEPEKKLRSFLLLLESNDDDVRAIAANSLKFFGNSVKEPLIKMMADGNHLIRSCALHGIAETRTIDVDLFRQAVQLATDPSEYVRKRVADVISMHGDVDLELSKKTVELLLNDGSRFVLLAAIEAIKCFPKEETTSFLQFLHKLLSFPSEDIQEAAALTLASLRKA